MQALSLHFRHYVAGFLAAMLTTSALAQAPGPDDEAGRIQAIAEEAYIYGLPIVMNYAVLYSYAVDASSSQYKAPFGQFKHYDRVFTPADTAVVTPNSDTPYSMAAIDLRSEPVVVSVPAVNKGRYYSMMLCDASTHNYGIIGSIATQGVAGDYLIVGPDWKGDVNKLPKGIRKVFRSGSQLSLILIRTQVFAPGDIDKVKAVQAGYKLQALSSWLGTAAPATAAAIDFPRVDAEMAKKHFFAYLDFSLQFIPATEDEKAIRAKLASLGVGAGDFSKFNAIAAKYGKEIAAGAAAGEAKVTQYVTQLGKRSNGWNLLMAGGGDRARYHGNWLERAAVAKAGIYAIDTSEAQYALTRVTADGEALDGSQHTYTLSFAAKDLPPANAFWSVTLYDGKTQLLVNNPIKRYLINSPMLSGLKRNPDGSLTLYIQKDSPGTDKESNWLPAPNGPIFLALRMYGPQARTLKGEWSVPPVVRAD